MRRRQPSAARRSPNASSTRRQGRHDHLPAHDDARQRRGQQPHHRRFEATVKALNAAGKLKDFKVDAGPQNIGIDVERTTSSTRSCTLIESRKDVVGAFARERLRHAGARRCDRQLKLNGQICAFGFDLGPKQQEQIRTGALTGSLGQQPFLQGFWPVMQLYLQIDRGISAANLDTRAQLVTKARSTRSASASRTDPSRHLHRRCGGSCHGTPGSRGPAR